MQTTTAVVTPDKVQKFLFFFLKTITAVLLNFMAFKASLHWSPQT